VISQLHHVGVPGPNGGRLIPRIVVIVANCWQCHKEYREGRVVWFESIPGQPGGHDFCPSCVQAMTGIPLRDHRNVSEAAMPLVNGRGACCTCGHLFADGESPMRAWAEHVVSLADGGLW